MPALLTADLAGVHVPALPTADLLCSSSSGPKDKGLVPVLLWQKGRS